MGRIAAALSTPSSSPTVRGDSDSALESTRATVPDPLSALNPRQRAAVEGYTDPLSTTYANGAQSYEAAYPPQKNENAAAVGMSRLLSSAKGSSAVSQLMEKYSVGSERRIEKLQSILSAPTHQDTQVLNKDGEVVRTLRAPVPKTDQLRAIDMLNRLDGSYAAADATVSVVAEAAKQLIRNNSHLLQ